MGEDFEREKMDKVNDLMVEAMTGKPTEVAPPVTPPGKKLTEEERLGMENIFLKLQSLQKDLVLLDMQHQLQKTMALGQMKDLEKELNEKRAALTAKYGVDISRTTVKADGTIVG